MYLIILYLRLLDDEEVYRLPVWAPLGMSLDRFVGFSIVIYIRNPATPMNNTDHRQRRKINQPICLVDTLVTVPIMLAAVLENMPTTLCTSLTALFT